MSQLSHDVAVDLNTHHLLACKVSVYAQPLAMQMEFKYERSWAEVSTKSTPFSRSVAPTLALMADPNVVAPNSSAGLRAVALAADPAVSGFASSVRTSCSVSSSNVAPTARSGSSSTGATAFLQCVPYVHWVDHIKVADLVTHQ